MHEYEIDDMIADFIDEYDITTMVDLIAQAKELKPDLVQYITRDQVIWSDYIHNKPNFKYYLK